MIVRKESIERAQEWLKWDPNEQTSKHLHELLKNEAIDSIAALFPQDGSRIGFGTAGLRSAMQIGPLHMNDLVIIQTAQGISKYCQQKNPSGAKQKVVIGYDHRENPKLNLSSLSFAILSTLVFEQAGMECVLLDGFVHTPLVAFATTKLNAAVGIMITASHNPKDDAGYKVYWKDGCQIRDPIDKEIAESISNNLAPWADYGAVVEQRKKRSNGDVVPTLGLSNPGITAEMRVSYFEAIQKSGLVTGEAKRMPDSIRPPGFAYTAMHGIGYPFAAQAFQTFGLPPFKSVPEQQFPDPMFPTVVFPNPEESGALDIAKVFAEDQNCDIVFANDPDADRLAIAERDRGSGEWTVFTGDQIGALLGLRVWETLGKSSEKPVAMCASTVSSKLLAEMARVEGFHFEDTLTGFKNIGTRALALDRSSHRSIFCYEEAIGFCCGDVIFDKDGVSAMGVCAELAYNVYARGLTLVKHLQENVYDKYGEFVSNNGYFFFDDKAVIQKIIDDIRNGGKYIEKVGGYEIESLRDLGEPGYDSSKPDKKPTLPTSNSSPMVTITFKNGCVAQFRASGTEPKFKYYIELKGQPGVPRSKVNSDLAAMSKVILDELLKPDENGLRKTR